MNDRSLGTYDIGDKPFITARYSDITGGEAVSDGCEFKLRKPSGTVLEYTEASADVVGVEENVWRLSCPILDESGVWWIRSASTSGIISAEEAYLVVKATQFSE